MAKINELRERRAKIWEQAKAFLDSHRNETGILSAEDTAVYEKMEKDIVDLGHEIERQQRADELERELNLPTNSPIVSKPDSGRHSKTGIASDAYNKAFWNQMRNRSTQEIRNILSEGVDSEGGFLVPETFENTLVQALDDELVIRQLAHTFTTASNAHKIPVVATRGKALWTEENAAIAESDTTFGQKTIGAHKLCALIKVSEELLNDSAFDLESYFNQEFARRIGEAEEEAFAVGDGNETYDTPVPLAKAMSAELSVELAEATLYADDGAAEVVKEFQSGTLTLGIDNIGTAVAEDLTGATIDKNRVLVSTSEDGAPPVAIGFRAKKANGKYRYFWLYRVKFGIPATNLTTKGESIEFSTPSIEGTVLRRNKVDKLGKHPWKAEISEDDTGVTASAIGKWYTEVYEPAYAE